MVIFMIKLALIPAGGLGIALLPVTRAIPKELIPFAGKPVIEHVIDNVKQCGIKNFVFVAGYKKTALLDYIGDGSLFGINASFIYQEKPTGPGDAILCSNTRITRDSSNQDFLVCFGDNIINPHSEIQETIDVHMKYKPIATILVFPTSFPTRYGIAEIRSVNNVERITRIIEKPKTAEDQENFRNQSGDFTALSSIMVFNTRIFEYLRKTDKDLENRLQIADALQKAIDDGEQVIAHHLKGQFTDVSTWDFLWDLRKYFRNLTDEELSEIIEERKSKVNKLGW